MLKKFLLCALIFLFFFSQLSNAAEPKEVDDFHEFSTEILQDDILYLGILVSFKEFDRLTRLEAAYNFQTETLNVFKNQIEPKYNQIIDNQNDQSQKIVEKLNDIEQTVSHQTFFEKYKGEILFIGGLFVGAVIVYGTEELINK